MYTWELWARPEQLPPPGQWRIWLLLMGRGAGKTRSAAEWIRRKAKEGSKRIALVGRTAADVRDVMVEGESGLLAICQPSERPTYEPSKRRLTFPNGSIAQCFSADEPNLLRGPQFDTAWCDELAAWEYPETFDMLRFGLRLGRHPQAVVSTTPRPTKLIKELMLESTTVVTRGSTFANAANLAPDFIRTMQDKYAGTRLGKQELEGIVLTDTQGALWNESMIQTYRTKLASIPELTRIVIGVDPSASYGPDSDATGIAVVGLGIDGRGYVLYTQALQGTPEQWARRVNDLYTVFHADRIIAEKNQGGLMVESVMRMVNPHLPIRLVHASKGKITRAEPVAALFEQGKISLAA